MGEERSEEEYAKHPAEPLEINPSGSVEHCDITPAHPRTEPYGTAIARWRLQAENWKVLIVCEGAVLNLRTTNLIGLSTEELSPFV